jgi:hypothetical protein
MDVEDEDVGVMVGENLRYMSGIGWWVTIQTKRSLCFRCVLSYMVPWNRPGDRVRCLAGSGHVSKTVYNDQYLHDCTRNLSRRICHAPKHKDLFSVMSPSYITK